MKITKIGQMSLGEQDGALYGDYLFRFQSDGFCRVFDARGLDNGNDTTLEVVGEFRLNPDDGILPHSNAVVFGSEKWEETDEFPLLYSNVYNNYQNDRNRREGTCCVYRITHTHGVFDATLVMLLRIGFTDDPVWRSEKVADIRPYGNFVIDRDKNILYAFTMRDADHTTRYFSFSLPKKTDGVLCPEYGVPVVVLGKEDILSQFDTEYHTFIQGACCHNGLIYSSEGFNREIPPALRVIDPAAQKQIAHVNLLDMGYDCEAEFIDFRGERCFYSDAHGVIYQVEFDL